MKETLQELLKKSYSPYSHFAVAAILKTKDGQVFEGVNIENASYGATVCAERVAILEAVKRGYRKGDFEELSIMVDSDKISSCCFLCRQVMVEFFEMDMPVFLYNRKGEVQKETVGTLCPMAFTGDDLV